MQLNTKTKQQAITGYAPPGTPSAVPFGIPYGGTSGVPSGVCLGEYPLQVPCPLLEYLLAVASGIPRGVFSVVQASWVYKSYLALGKTLAA